MTLEQLHALSAFWSSKADDERQAAMRLIIASGLNANNYVDAISCLPLPCRELALRKRIPEVDIDAVTRAVARMP